MTNEVFVFVDTNVFLQCKPLEDVDWTLVGEWESFKAIVTRPVQTEIDALKSGGNSRLSSRARKAAELFFSMLQLENETKLVRQWPTVSISLQIRLKPEPSAAGDLDYNNKDDQIVGIALAFRNSNPDTNVILLSGDSGPLLSAKHVGVRGVRVPDKWLLSAEPDEASKRIRALEEQVAKLSKLGPIFEVQISDFSNKKVELKRKIYTPLESTTVEQLLEKITLAFPKSKEFGPKERQVKRHTQGIPSYQGYLFAKSVFEPASAEEIHHYHQLYREWVSDCRAFLESAHTTLNACQAAPLVTFSIRNIGTRPGEDVLVTIETRGPLMVRQFDNAREQRQAEPYVTLSPPPEPPKGTWKTITTGLPVIGESLFQNFSELPIFPSHDIKLPEIPASDELHWREEDFEQPKKTVGLKCRQFRHASEARVVSVEVCAEAKQFNNDGLLIVKIHAKNLAIPVEVQIPASLIFEVEDSVAYAKNEVADFVVSNC